MDTLNQLIEFFEREIFKRKVPEGFDADQELLESGILSSIAVVELVSHLEEAYGISINIDDIVPDNFGSLKVLSGFVDRKISG
jgi:acyl carrier protein